MKIAIPVWGNRMSPVFDTSSRLMIVDIADNQERGRTESILQGQDLSWRCIQVRDLDVDVLICGAITGYFIRLLSAAGIEVISGISGDPEEVLNAYLEGTLSSARFLMPGCKALRRGPQRGIRRSRGQDLNRKQKRGGFNGRC
jgi:predicted Fe-Mo cluster-binding NifX family protein